MVHVFIGMYVSSMNCSIHRLYSVKRQGVHSKKRVIYNLLLFLKSKTVTVKVLQLGNGKPHFKHDHTVTVVDL